MFITVCKTSGVLLALALILAGSERVAQRVVAEPEPVVAQATQQPQAAAAGLTEAEFKELKPILDVKNQLWTTIPWKYSITEARKVAAENKKLILLNVNTGNCLGNV